MKCADDDDDVAHFHRAFIAMFSAGIVVISLSHLSNVHPSFSIFTGYSIFSLNGNVPVVIVPFPMSKVTV